MNVEKEDLSAFQCRRCGACCKWEGPVRVTEQEIDAIADYLGIELQRFIRDYTYLTPDRRSLSLLEKEDGSCFSNSSLRHRTCASRKNSSDKENRGTVWA